MAQLACIKLYLYKDSAWKL